MAVSRCLDCHETFLSPAPFALAGFGLKWGINFRLLRPIRYLWEYLPPRVFIALNFHFENLKHTLVYKHKSTIKWCQPRCSRTPIQTVSSRFKNLLLFSFIPWTPYRVDLIFRLWSFRLSLDHWAVSLVPDVTCAVCATFFISKNLNLLGKKCSLWKCFGYI